MRRIGWRRFWSKCPSNSRPHTPRTPTLSCGGGHRAAASPRQHGFHQSARLAEIHLAGIALLESGHDLAHVLDAGRAGRLDDLRNGRLRLRFRHLLGKISRDDLDLAALAIGKLRPASLVVKLDRFLALLDQLLQQAEKLLVGERLLALALRLEVGVLERGVDQAQRRYPALVAGFHGVFQGGVDLIAQHGYGLSQSCARLVKSRTGLDRRRGPRLRPSMTEKQPAGASPKEDHAHATHPEAVRAQASWVEPNASALLVLADGTLFEGFGFGATGHAVGEVCFNTAMTGYEEILTDPSYAGQIITFTFPHIGNVGTNDE